MRGREIEIGIGTGERSRDHDQVYNARAKRDSGGLKCPDEELPVTLGCPYGPTGVMASIMVTASGKRG